ncbi:MAG: hypothetical protein K0Q93_157 [Nocardioidaceae bacterium]|nr:hypothetical protein [Nocardioidaceae bacterium]
MTSSYSRAEVLGFRARAQQLDRSSGRPTGTAILDLGVQDSGADGARWALTNRGVGPAEAGVDELAAVWTVRGAPHVYRRLDLPSVAAAVAPFSEADAGKRILDASKPLKEAGIDNLEALDTVAATMRRVVAAPMRKGAVSARLTELLDPPYLRFCRPCNATHPYEMPFRLAALRAGLELEAQTSPPVLRPLAGFQAAETAAEQHDVVRAYLRLLGPATPRHVADYLDAPVTDVRARWPSDAVEVLVGDELRWVLAADEGALAAGPARLTRLLGPFDLFLQARDRTLLVDDRTHAKHMWPTLGRPGGVLVDSEVVGAWRPRKAGRKLRVHVELWTDASRAVRTSIEEQAQRLADHRHAALSGVEYAD